MKTYKILFAVSFILLAGISITNAQNTFPTSGSAGIGTRFPDSSAILDINSTKQGLLIPRMTYTQRNAINMPATGLLIYQTTQTPGFYYYNDSAWLALSHAYSAGPGISISGNTISNIAPDKIVTLTGTGTTTITGTYPNFTINSTGSGNSWSLNGNTGTNDSVNFIGTTDAQSLSFKINNQQSGLLDSAKGTTSFGYKTLLKNTGTGNSSFGYEALTSNTSGLYNTAAGYKSLFTNTSGVANTAVGTQALYLNAQGVSNTATGDAAMLNNISGSHNTATGNDAMEYNTSGNYNTATGDNAMNQNKTGNYNTVDGRNALYGNTTGNYNCAFGSYALELGSTGYSNVAIGFKTLYNGNAVHNMVAIGDSALFTQSVADVSSGELRVAAINIAVGTKALYSNSTGYQNTAAGHQALYSNTTSSNNTALGFQALYSSTTGGGNTALGETALFNNVTGVNNTAVGIVAGPSSSNLSNTTALGNGATTTASNQVRVGNSSVTSIGGQVGWSNLSDARIKSNIKENVPGLAFINLLRPITYHFNMAKENELLGIKNNENDKATNANLEKINFTGFLAQDVDKAAQKINYDFSGVDKSGSLMALRYSDFVVPLVKAVQELSSENDALKKNYDAKIDALQKQIEDLKSMIVSGQSIANNQQSTIVSSASLSQNIPNPFGNTTIINYALPQKFSSAQIIFTDQNGKIIKQVNINNVGKGTLNVDATTLAAGAYNYSLMVDGKLINTKTMVIAK